MAAQVVVLGAQGVLGTFVAKALGEKYEVLRTGRRPEDAADFRLVDLGDAAAVEAVCAEADLVINCVLDRTFAAERQVLATGGKLLNVANLSLTDRRQLVELGQAGSRGLVALHAGLTPGINSLAAADLLASCPEADEVRLVMTFSLYESGGAQAAGEFLYPMLTSRAQHPVVVFELDEPYGARSCPIVGDAETGVFGTVPGTRKVSVAHCYQEKWFHQLLLGLNRVHAMRLLPKWLFTAEQKIPQELTKEPKCDRVEVRRAGKTLAARLVKGRGDYRLTVAGTVSFADAMLGLSEAEPGVRGVDELFTFAALRPAFEAHGVSFREYRHAEPVH